jgi:hypothetical protein
MLSMLCKIVLVVKRGSQKKTASRREIFPMRKISAAAAPDEFGSMWTPAT